MVTNKNAQIRYKIFRFNHKKIFLVLQYNPIISVMKSPTQKNEPTPFLVKDNAL